MNFIQVFGVIVALYYLLAKLIFPSLEELDVAPDGSPQPPTFVWVLRKAFQCVLPATFCGLSCWFGLLHSWQNAFAEMLRFGDREFYSVSFTRHK
jgi:sterol O-acyltransferase